PVMVGLLARYWNRPEPAQLMPARPFPDPYTASPTPNGLVALREAAGLTKIASVVAPGTSKIATLSRSAPWLNTTSLAPRAKSVSLLKIVPAPHIPCRFTICVTRQLPNVGEPKLYMLNAPETLHALIPKIDGR